ncbi:MAG: LPXTG cell wall anchor domain-containing protein, partial [Burkholderiales bacterium]|nr:LPXTG cell wall anchor domain-containing protein [Burkholderiales bacterium]
NVKLHVIGTADITGATVNVGIIDTSAPLEIGDEITLISADTLIGTVAAASQTGTLNGHAYTLSTTSDGRLLLRINPLFSTTATSIPTTGNGTLAALGLLLAGLAAVSIRRRGRRG